MIKDFNYWGNLYLKIFLGFKNMGVSRIKKIFFALTEDLNLNPIRIVNIRGIKLYLILYIPAPSLPLT